MKPEKNEDAKDKPHVLKEEAIALAKAGDLPGALTVAQKIEDAAERAAALEAITVALVHEKENQPAVDVAAHEHSAKIGLGVGFALHALGFLIFFISFDGNPFGAYAISSVIVLLSFPFIIWGSMNYAAKKGYSMAVGLVGLLGFLGMPFLMVLPDKRSEDVEAQVGWHRWAGAVLLTLGVSLFVAGRLVPLVYQTISGKSILAEGEAIMFVGFVLIVFAVVLLFLLPKNFCAGLSKRITRLTIGGTSGVGLGLALITFGIWATKRKWGPLQEGIYAGTHRLDPASDQLVPLSSFEKLFAIDFGPACIITGLILGLCSLGLLVYGYFKAKKMATEEDRKTKA